MPGIITSMLITTTNQNSIGPWCWRAILRSIIRNLQTLTLRLAHSNMVIQALALHGWSVALATAVPPHSPPIKCQCYTTRQASASTSTFSEWTWPCQFPSVFFFQLSQNRTFVTSWHRLLTNQLSFWSLNRRSQGLKGTWSTNTDQ